jgi:hypothetical protein
VRKFGECHIFVQFWVGARRVDNAPAMPLHHVPVAGRCRRRQSEAP